MEELRASFSVVLILSAAQGLLVHPTATRTVSPAQGKKFRLWGQRLWLEVQSCHWLAVIKAASLYTSHSCGTGDFKQEMHFFLRVGPRGQVGSNKTDTARRFST